MILSDAGVDINAPLPWGEYPLEFACSISNDRLALAFLANGASPNLWVKASPLCLSIWIEDKELCEELLDAGADIDKEVYLSEEEEFKSGDEFENGFYNPDHRVIDKERWDFEDEGLPYWKIMEHNFSANDELNRKTPLNLAVYIGSIEITEILVRRGAKVTNKDFEILEDSPYEQAQVNREKLAEILSSNKLISGD